MGRSRLTTWVIGGWAPTGASGKGVGETSRRKTVKDWKGGVLKRLDEREDSVAEKRWGRRSKTASWYMSLWRGRTSDGLAIRILAKIGFPTGPVSGNVVGGMGVGVGGGGGAAAAIASFLRVTQVSDRDVGSQIGCHFISEVTVVCDRDIRVVSSQRLYIQIISKNKIFIK